MPEKSSNKASIVVAVVTLLLILGGVYLLNLNMNPRSDETDNNTTNMESNEDENESTSLADSDNSDLNDTPDTDLTEDLADPQDETPNDISISDGTGSSSQPEQTPTEPEDTTTPQPADPNNQNTTPGALSPQQMTAVYTGSSGGTSSWEVTDCGVPNAQFCVAGATMSLIGVSDYTTLTVGQEYLFNANINEIPGGFEIVINSVAPVN